MKFGLAWNGEKCRYIIPVKHSRWWIWKFHIIVQKASKQLLSFRYNNRIFYIDHENIEQTLIYKSVDKSSKISAILLFFCKAINRISNGKERFTYANRKITKEVLIYQLKNCSQKQRSVKDNRLIINIKNEQNLTQGHDLYAKFSTNLIVINKIIVFTAISMEKLPFRIRSILGQTNIVHLNNTHKDECPSNTVPM